MSVLQKRLKDQTDSGVGLRKSSPVMGKLSIGIPSDEPALVGPDLIDKKLAKDIVLAKKPKPTGISRGAKLTAAHIEALQRAGITEVPVVYSAFPQRLDHFRLTRQATTYGGYLFDPAFYERYGLEEGFTEVPIVLTSNDINKVIRSRLVNYDRAEKCVFCTSNDGETARRLQGDPEHGGYQEGYYEVECIPFHDDPRKQQGKAICEFRKHGAALPCKFAGSLSFQILSPNPEVGIPLARYFKMETTSAESGLNWTKALTDETDGVLKHFGRIAFVPLKLSVVKENTVYFDGNVRKDTQVARTVISVDPEYLDRYQDVVDKTFGQIKTYRSMGGGWTAAGEAPVLDVNGDVDLVDEEFTDDQVAAWTAEFNPRERQRELIADGVLTAEDVEADALEQGQGGRPASAPRDSQWARHAAYKERYETLMAAASRLAPDTYQRFYAKREAVNSTSIRTFEIYIGSLMRSISKEEQAANFDVNTAVSDDDLVPFVMDEPIAADEPMVILFDSDEDPPAVDSPASDEA